MKTQVPIHHQDQNEGDSDTEVTTFEGARRARRVKKPKENKKEKKISTGKTRPEVVNRCDKPMTIHQFHSLFIMSSHWSSCPLIGHHVLLASPLTDH